MIASSPAYAITTTAVYSLSRQSSDLLINSLQTMSTCPKSSLLKIGSILHNQLPTQLLNQHTSDMNRVKNSVNERQSMRVDSSSHSYHTILEHSYVDNILLLAIPQQHQKLEHHDSSSNDICGESVSRFTCSPLSTHTLLGH